MAQRKGLGRGVDSLIPQAKTMKSTVQKDKDNANGVTMLKITEVEPNKEQPRKVFNEDRLHELSESIKQFGIVEPLIVVAKKDCEVLFLPYDIIENCNKDCTFHISLLKNLPDLILRSMCLPKVTDFWEKAVNTSPAKVLRNNASLSPVDST